MVIAKVRSTATESPISAQSGRAGTQILDQMPRRGNGREFVLVGKDRSAAGWAIPR